ncbi:MAG: hypothetical protein IPK28_20205 [Devosia sp.]|nr:hypothetical protein [Devosia sp.]
MSSATCDHLVIGSTPLAALLAALLATEHGRRVAIVTDPYSPFAMRRSFDLSMAPLTRPETLMLLRRCGEETLALLARAGKSLVDKVDPQFVAETPASQAALGHFRQLARLLEIAAEPVADRTVAQGAAICRVRGVSVIAPERFGPALDAFLDRHGVRRCDRLSTTVALRKDGSCEFDAGGQVVEAAATVLADDASIVALLTPETRDRVLLPAPALAILAQPARPMTLPPTVFLDRGVTVGREPSGSIAAIVEGDPATASERLAASVQRALPLRRAGEAQLHRLATLDGAPFVGPGRGHKATIIAGLGMTGAFLAPAIARMLVGGSPPDEAAWFARRGPGRGNQRLDAAEFVAVVP